MGAHTDLLRKLKCIHVCGVVAGVTAGLAAFASIVKCKVDGHPALPVRRCFAVAISSHILYRLFRLIQVSVFGSSLCMNTLPLPAHRVNPVLHFYGFVSFVFPSAASVVSFNRIRCFLPTASVVAPTTSAVPPTTGGCVFRSRSPAPAG